MDCQPGEHGQNVSELDLQQREEFAVGLCLAEPGRDQAENPERGNSHQQQDEAHQRVVDADHEIGHRLGPLPHGGQHPGEYDAEGNQRQQVHADHGLQQIVREQHQHQALEDGADAGRPLRLG